MLITFQTKEILLLAHIAKTILKIDEFQLLGIQRRYFNQFDYSDTNSDVEHEEFDDNVKKVIGMTIK